MEKKRFNSIIHLLEDPDQLVYNEVSRKIIHEGPKIIPDLEKAWESTFDEFVQERLEDIIQTIQFRVIKQEFNQWITSGGQNLFEGAFWVAKYQYPELNYLELTKAIDAISQEIWLEINNKLTALEKTRIINQFLFVEKGFTKNKNNPRNPQNLFINTVLESKKGSSTSLSILYSIVAEKLGLPIYCVNLPSNTILAYVDEYAYHPELLPEKPEVLFYINPMSFGDVLGKQEIDFFLKHLKIKPKDSYYLPSNNINIIYQLLVDIKSAYEQLGKKHKVEDMNILQGMMKKKITGQNGNNYTV